MPDEIHRLDLIQRYAERLLHKPDQAPNGERQLPVDLPGAAAPAQVAPEVATAAAVAPPPTDLPQPQRITINLAELGRLGFLIPGSGKTVLSEEFRNVKRSLLKCARATGKEAVRNGNLILVTSARPGEGKTFTAANLALSFASERDLQVLLIDADAVNQGASKTFGLPSGKGLVDLLLDETVTLNDVLLKTSVANLAILPAGRPHPDLPELLSSQRMLRLVNQLVAAHPAQIAVIDSPPLLATAEAAVLASHVGQTVVVVEHNKTSWRLIDESLPKIEHCPSISFVLNRVDPMIWGQHFNGAYGYGGDGGVNEG